MPMRRLSWGFRLKTFQATIPLAGVDFQQALESRAFVLGGRNYNAPAQRIGDFLAGRPSTSLGSVEPSYKPGVTPCDLSEALPDYAIEALREALPAFDRKLKGFAMDDAVLTASKPVRLHPYGSNVARLPEHQRQRTVPSRRRRRLRRRHSVCRRGRNRSG